MGANLPPPVVLAGFPGRRWVQCLVVAALYVLTARIGLQLAIPPGNVTPLWPPAGIALAAVLLLGPRVWPGVALGAIAANVGAYFDASDLEALLRSLVAGGCNGLGDALGALAAWALLSRAGAVARPLQRSRHVALLLAGAVLLSLISAVFGVGSLTAVGLVPVSALALTFSTWAVGDIVGALVFAPLVLTLAARGEPGAQARPAGEHLLAWLVLVGCLAASWLPVFPRGIDWIPIALAVPVLVIMLLRLGGLAGLAGFAVVAMAAAFATAAGRGAFADGDPALAMLELQFFVGAIGVILLVLHAVTDERAEAAARLARAHHALEDLVADRTRELEQALSAQQRLNQRLLVAGEELADTQAQLAQAQKLEALGTMAGGIAHDFNNILNVISGSAELLDMDLPEGHAAARHAVRIRDSTARAARLVEQILTFGRARSEALDVIDLRSAVADGLDLARTATPSGVEVQLHLGEQPLWVRADATQVQQVVVNLVTNAVYALSEGDGTVAVRLGPADDGSGSGWLDVVDTGVGMTASTRERVFDPFFTTKPLGEGTGLGLSVVHGVARGHGGTVEIDSAPGQGTRVRVTWPLVAAPADGDAAVVEAADVTLPTGLRVLLVDDEPDLLATFASALRSAGCVVDAHADPRSALAALRAAPAAADVLVTDVRMPGMSGVELLAAARQLRADLPVVLVTGQGAVPPIADLPGSGPVVVLRKPVGVQDLRRELAHLIGG